MIKLIELVKVIDKEDCVIIKDNLDRVEFSGLLDDMYTDITENRKDIHNMNVVRISSNGYHLEYEMCTTIAIE